MRATAYWEQTINAKGLVLAKKFVCQQFPAGHLHLMSLIAHPRNHARISNLLKSMSKSRAWQEILVKTLSLRSWNVLTDRMAIVLIHACWVIIAAPKIRIRAWQEMRVLFSHLKR